MNYLKVLIGILLVVASVAYLLHIIKKEKKEEEEDSMNLYFNIKIYSGLIALAIAGFFLIYKGLVE
jgi:uncharacterized BrkB/YihY/UPF0761 family membrane protein